jgi:hypothetical protein
MSNLSKEEKEIILDFYFRCGDQRDLDRARDLIAVNPEAAKLYTALQETLTLLDNTEYEPCPDNLAELTVAKLKLAASASTTKLQSLLEKEKKKTFLNQNKITTVHQRHWTNILEVAAVAAVLLIITGLGFPLLSNMRQN